MFVGLLETAKGPILLGKLLIFDSLKQWNLCGSRNSPRTAFDTHW